jgi:drug/metabolite transporter (DMT)-like permease
VAGSIVGYSAYLWLVRVAPISLVSTSAYVNPIVAVLLGNLIAAEPLTPQLIVTTAVIVSAVVLISMEPRPGNRQNPEPAT